MAQSVTNRDEGARLKDVEVSSSRCQTLAMVLE